jgi:hypothetical protein
VSRRDNERIEDLGRATRDAALRACRAGMGKAVGTVPAWSETAEEIARRETLTLLDCIGQWPDEERLAAAGIVVKLLLGCIIQLGEAATEATAAVSKGLESKN